MQDKRHLDWSSHYGTAYGSDQQTDTQTTLHQQKQAASVHCVNAMRPKFYNRTQWPAIAEYEGSESWTTL